MGMKKLEGKVAIITGGAGGIGKGMANAFVKEGAKVVIIDMNPELGEQTVKELQAIEPDSMFIEANLAEHDRIPTIIEQVIEKYGKIDVMVNNAHASKQAPFEEVTQEHFDLSFNTGFYPTFYFMQAALPYLKETKGKIINFASGAGIAGNIHQASYAAAKEAIRGITRVAANEFGQYGINVNLISPIANSPGVQQWAASAPEHYNTMIQKIPLRRLGETESDIGRVAVFLASEDSDYITGQTIMVDGGSIQLR